ncbi:nuclear pore complex protein Nup205 isoform X2 [Parasteatoda tepidariorum]|uniref:nuclear pore complex protein Nup205 isoform X2 n=1 Tax=Parasteatoda tepidariorum TaxID=114398 RepID=UPI001C728B15|nr:nuclear pore complex protein Nup205 [Parasteatoda tepidariorum]
MNSENVVLNLNDNTLWAPYKKLYCICYNAIIQKDVSTIQEFETVLKKYKPDLLCLLRNPPKSPIHREAVKQASTNGIAVVGRPVLQILPQSLIDEALIISDMFDLNEVTSLELLISGQHQQPRFPGLTRGLVAMLLYYDGRRNLVNTLQLLVEAREGRTWTHGISFELSSIITNFTNQLKEDGIFMKIMDLIENYDTTKELELLHRNRALGGPRYRKQVTDLINEIKLTLSEIVFGWSCQGSLTKDEILRVLAYLSKQAGVSSDGSLDKPTLFIAMAFLYIIDVSCLQNCDEADGIIQKLNLFSIPDIGSTIHKLLVLNQDKWKVPELKSVLLFAWGVTLTTLSRFSANLQAFNVDDCTDDDEKTIDLAIDQNAFLSLRSLIVKNSTFHNQEFFLKRVHSIVTDFIVLMPLKVKELRNRGDETARIIESHFREGLEPPSNLPLHFEHLLNLISDLYLKDPLNLELAADFWCPSDSLSELSYYNRPSHRQIALFKFIHIAGDLLPAPLFIPFHEMLRSISNSPRCAHNCFTMLKMNCKNGNQNIVSWDHFFSTLHRYYSSLHEEVPSAFDRQRTYPQRMHAKVITPLELDGLISVLKLISQIVKLDEIARITLSENTHYVPTVVILGLITCSVPASLKAALLNCMAAFATSPDISLNIWQGLEMAQVIPTVKSVAVYHPSGILMELEEVETRMEEYPVTRGMLTLLDSLLNHPFPNNLGHATRHPGIEPYLEFVLDCVLLKCNSRAYKNPGEKWKIMALCYKILEKVMKSYQFDNIDSKSSILLFSKMLQDSGLLRVVLFTLDEGMRILDQYAPTPGQSDLEECALLSLKLMHATLSKQGAFLQWIRDAGCDLIVTPFENLLLNINPRSGQADHLLVIAKYVTYNASLPQHSLFAISIIQALCSSLNISKHFVGVLDGDANESDILLKGFVEVVEVDAAEENEDGVKDIQARSKARQQLLQLLLKCLRQPGTNISHYLLGFNLRKPVSQTEIQDPGVMGSKRTCFHAVLSFLDCGSYSNAYPSNIQKAPLATELAYQLIYVLCTNSDTSGPTLRYLRSTHDFMYRHLQFLPFKCTGSSSEKILRQQSWLLRSLAVELRVISAHHQRSHVQRLLSGLIDDKPPIDSGNLDATFEQPLSVSVSSYSFMKSASGTYRRKLMQILDGIEFEHSLPSMPHWEYFENEEIIRVLKECEIQEGLIDIQELHKRLSEETVGLQNVLRPVMLQEIAKVLEYAVECNEAREIILAKRMSFEGWRQVTEVLLIACPLDILGSEKKDQMVLEISQELLSKVMSPEILAELMPPASSVILTLMSTLRNSMITSLMKPHTESLAESPLIPVAHHSSLLAVLRAVVDCLMKTGIGFQRVRANFYTAFLNLLCIVHKPYDMQTDKPSDVGYAVLDQSSETKKLRTEYMDVILSFGETIMEIVCRDACTGHDITKMLAMAVLDVALSLNTQQQWLAFLVSKGYLRHILDSLSKDDEELQNLFNKNSNSFRIFYVFESKIALLTRIACSTSGALALLRNGAIHRMAECRALDLRPDAYNEYKQDSKSWISPDLMKCYSQIFMAIMKLILSIAMTLGSSHREASLQLLEFVVCNGELFSHVIRDPSNLYSLEALQELSIISAVLSRASFDDINAGGRTFASDQRGHLLLLRQHMLMLIPRLMAVDSRASHSSHLSPEILALMKLSRLQIAYHILGSCSSIMTKSGTDPKNSTIIFGPFVGEALTVDSFNMLSTGFQKRSGPDLGLLIRLLYQSATELQISTGEQKLIHHRLQSIATLTSDELSEYLPSFVIEEQPTIQLQRELAKSSLQKLIELKSKEISVLSYIIETSAFLLLRHLEYYFFAFKKESNSFTASSKPLQQIRRLQDVEGSAGDNFVEKFTDVFQSLPSHFDFDSFKNDVQTTLGEPFFRKLKPAEQYLNEDRRSQTSFLEAIVNRLKRLVRIQIR